uniref:Uncharacterized protein n=1 Tax=Knipowitschia caucasica TaxID=637954 RepID=A0AAV2JV06_KNICA
MSSLLGPHDRSSAPRLAPWSSLVLPGSPWFSLVLPACPWSLRSLRRWSRAAAFITSQQVFLRPVCFTHGGEPRSARSHGGGLRTQTRTGTGDPGTC